MAKTATGSRGKSKRRTPAKPRRSASANGSKLRAQIEELERRLAEARAKFEAIEEFDLRDASTLLEMLVARVESEGERLYLRRGGKRVAALVPADEAEFLDKNEDRHWNEVADKALQEEGTISLEQAKKELGL
jgi:antitoxin (DNA-binding transcriptional repressor) of toxin-antitoxin stability system